MWENFRSNTNCNKIHLIHLVAILFLSTLCVFCPRKRKPPTSLPVLKIICLERFDLCPFLLICSGEKGEEGADNSQAQKWLRRRLFFFQSLLLIFTVLFPWLEKESYVSSWDHLILSASSLIIHRLMHNADNKLELANIPKQLCTKETQDNRLILIEDPQCLSVIHRRTEQNRTGQVSNRTTHLIMNSTGRLIVMMLMDDEVGHN